MMKFVTAAIAAGALCITGAAAGPLGSMTASQTADDATPRKGAGVLAYFVDRLSVSIATVAGSVGYSADKADDKGAHPSHDECTAGDDADEAEDAKSEKFKQAGPEPIYFGF